MEAAFVAFVEDLRRDFDRGNASLLSLLDLSVAFDAVNHDYLLDSLIGLGMDKLVLLQQDLEAGAGGLLLSPWPLVYGVLQVQIIGLLYT